MFRYNWQQNNAIHMTLNRSDVTSVIYYISYLIEKQLFKVYLVAFFNIHFFFQKRFSFSNIYLEILYILFICICLI